MLNIPLKLAQKFDIFGKEYPEEVNKFYLRNIRKSIDNDEQHAIFYRIEDTPVVAGVPADKFKTTLEDIKGEFIKIESYELARECQDLIDELKIKQIIKESQK